MTFNDEMTNNLVILIYNDIEIRTIGRCLITNTQD